MNYRIIKLPDVADLVSLSTASIYRLMKKGEFPKQIKLAERSSGWLIAEVEEWLDNKINSRNGGDQLNIVSIIDSLCLVMLTTLFCLIVKKVRSLVDITFQIPSN